MLKCRLPLLQEANITLHSGKFEYAKDFPGSFTDDLDMLLLESTQLERVSLFSQTPELNIGIKYCPSLLGLSITHAVNFKITEMDLPNLTELTIDGFYLPSSDSIPSSLLATFFGVTTLTIEDVYEWDHIDFLLQMMTSLQYLTILTKTKAYTNIGRDSGYLTLLDECVNLLTAYEGLADDILCPQLVRLTSNSYPLEWDAFIWMIRSRNPRGTAILQSSCQSLTHIGLPGLPHPDLLRPVISALRGDSLVGSGVPDR